VLAGVRPGDQLGLELVRGTEELHLSVTLGTEPEGPERPNRWQHFGGRS
jgi:hypothetical protein